MRRAVGVLVCVLLLGACSSKKDESQAAQTPPPNQRRIDSAIAKSGIPMTSAIGKAMGAADAASAQADAHDSVLNNMK